MPTATQLKADVARKEAALEEAKKAHEEALSKVAEPRTPEDVFNEILDEICSRLGNRPHLLELIQEFKDFKSGSASAPAAATE